jgi:hypothetical protein
VTSTVVSAMLVVLLESAVDEPSVDDTPADPSDAVSPGPTVELVLGPTPAVALPDVDAEPSPSNAIVESAQLVATIASAIAHHLPPHCTTPRA